jgi:hypothetical protein
VLGDEPLTDPPGPPRVRLAAAEQLRPGGEGHAGELLRRGTAGGGARACSSSSPAGTISSADAPHAHEVADRAVLGAGGCGGAEVVLDFCRLFQLLKRTSSAEQLPSPSPSP